MKKHSRAYKKKNEYIVKKFNKTQLDAVNMSEYSLNNEVTVSFFFGLHYLKKNKPSRPKGEVSII